MEWLRRAEKETVAEDSEYIFFSQKFGKNKLSFK